MENKANVLITGAGGFVGQVLTKLLLNQGYSVRGIVRNRVIDFSHPHFEQIVLPDLAEFQQSIFDDIDVIVHLAAYVHKQEPKEQDKKLYYDINLDLTSKLAEAALHSTVQQFIYMSTIKVNGEQTEKDMPFTDEDEPDPQDDYAKSKYLAELNLKRVLVHSDMAYTIIRPPLVYGPTATGNLEELVRLVQKNSVLLRPLGGIKNKRSLIHVNMLAQYIQKAILNSSVYNQMLLVSDGNDISTPELIKYIAYLNNTHVNLMNISPTILKWIAKLAGVQDKVQKLTSNLQIDSRKSMALLDSVE